MKGDRRNEDFRPAQEKLIQSNYVSICINLLSEKTVNKCNMLCLWLLIGLGRLWVEYEEARWLAIRNVTYERVYIFILCYIKYQKIVLIINIF